MNRKKSVTTMTRIYCLCVAILFGGSYLFAQDLPNGNLGEILRRFGESYSYGHNVSMQLDVNVKSSSFDGYRKINSTFRRDGNRTEWLGESNYFEEDGTVVSKYVDKYTNVMNDEYWLRSEQNANMNGPRGFLRRSFQSEQKRLLSNPSWGGFLSGISSGNDGKGIFELLEMSDRVVLRESLEDVGGESCYVIEGLSKYGQTTVWLAPSKGFNALKYSVHKESQHFINDSLASDHGIIESHVDVELDIQAIEGVFMPVSGKIVNSTLRKEGKRHTTTYEAKRTEIDLDPDFEALHAFELNLPDHTFVHDEDFDGVKWNIIGGKLKPYVDDVSMDAIEQELQRIQEDGTGVVADLKLSQTTQQATLGSNSFTDQEGLATVQLDGQDSLQYPHPMMAESEPSIRVFLWAILGLAVCVIAGVLRHLKRRKT